MKNLSLAALKQFKLGLNNQIPERIDDVPGLTDTVTYFDMGTGWHYRVDEARMRVQRAPKATKDDPEPKYGDWEALDP